MTWRSYQLSLQDYVIFTTMFDRDQAGFQLKSICFPSGVFAYLPRLTLSAASSKEVFPCLGIVHSLLKAGFFIIPTLSELEQAPERLFITIQTSPHWEEKLFPFSLTSSSLNKMFLIFQTISN